VDRIGLEKIKSLFVGTNNQGRTEPDPKEMNPEFFSVPIAMIAICAYLIGGYLCFKPLRTDFAAAGFGWLAVSFHVVYTSLVAYQNAAFNFSFFSTAALVALIVALLLLLAMLNKPVKNLGMFIFPITALMLAIDLFLPEKQRSLNTHSWQMNLHILSSLVAFGLLNIAAIQAVLLAIQNQQLKSHPPKRYIQSLPPLQAMESLLFQMIGAGLGFLSIALVTGFLFIDDLFAQHLAHKTFFSIMAWLIFSGLLFGRWRYGWRGATAVKWTLVGFVLLILAYFGSKLVLELILKR
jgi:ABC-type uncharacterized transport system permease subunit